MYAYVSVCLYVCMYLPMVQTLCQLRQGHGQTTPPSPTLSWPPTSTCSSCCQDGPPLHAGDVHIIYTYAYSCMYIYKYIDRYRHLHTSHGNQKKQNHMNADGCGSDPGPQWTACTMMLLAVGVRDTTMATNHFPVATGPGISRDT